MSSNIITIIYEPNRIFEPNRIKLIPNRIQVFLKKTEPKLNQNKKSIPHIPTTKCTTYMSQKTGPYNEFDNFTKWIHQHLFIDDRDRLYTILRWPS